MAEKRYTHEQFEAIPTEKVGDNPYRYNVGGKWYVTEKGHTQAHKAIVDKPLPTLSVITRPELSSVVVEEPQPEPPAVSWTPLDLHIGKLALKAGDVLVVKLGADFNAVNADDLHQAIEQILPEKVRVLYITPDIDLSVLTKAEINARAKKADDA